jgi:hypothetical protein
MSEEAVQKQEESHSVLDLLFEKYRDDPYMLSKTHNYVCNQLPNILENLRIQHEQRVSRIEELTNEQESFILSFLNNNHYFYAPSTEKFFYYDGFHYQEYNEDNILHQVLTTITKDRNLMSWKQRTRIYIMKRIKDNYILKSIPESNTIQHVLELLCPSIFSTKTEAKYFLTIIGDNLWKKQGKLLHFIDVKAKPFLRELNILSQNLLGLNLLQSIKHKYHDHEYANCRLLKVNDIIKMENFWKSFLYNSIIDILCVASHYSIRYGSSDNYIENSSNDIRLQELTFYLKDTTPLNIIQKFIHEYLQISVSANTVKSLTNSLIVMDNSQNSVLRATQINWKNMQYLWKHFLDSNNLPTIMFQTTLKALLTENLSEYYNEELDSFIGISSKYLPEIQQFLSFWETTIETDEFESDFEIEEITRLFNQWTSNSVMLGDKQILDIISYFFPEMEIEKDTYICKIRCSLWDKQMDINVAMDNMKQSLRMRYYARNGGINNYERATSPISGCNISIYDAYLYYCKYFSSKNLIVSKSYFEKHIFDTLEPYIIDYAFISIEWILV